MEYLICLYQSRMLRVFKNKMFFKKITNKILTKTVKIEVNHLERIPRFSFKLKRLFKSRVRKPPYLRYHDIVDVLPHTMFQLLCDFVEKEFLNYLKTIKETEQDQKEKENEENEYYIDKIMELYNWWNDVYLVFDAFENYDKNKATPKDEMFVKVNDKGEQYYTMQLNEYDKQFFDEANRKDEAMNLELKKKMHELVDVCGYLWV